MGLSGTIWDNMGLSGTIFDYPGVSGTIWDYLVLSGTIMGLYGTSSDYLDLSGTIWDYLRLSQTRIQVKAGESKSLLFETFSFLYFFSQTIPRGARAPKKLAKTFSWGLHK